MGKVKKYSKDDAVVLPKGVLSFVKIKDLQYSEDDKEKERGKYSFNVILPADTDISVLEDAVKQAARDKLGEEKANALGKRKKLKLPIRKGEDICNDKGEMYEGYQEDSIVIPVSFYQPQVWLDQFKNKIDSDSKQGEDTFYSGCEAVVAITLKGFDNESKGVSARCYALMKVAEGTRFTGSVVGDADDVFEDIDAEEMSPFDDEAPESAQAAKKEEDDDDDW